MVGDFDGRAIVRRDFWHSGIRYLFQWNLRHHRSFDSHHSRDLWHALSKVADGRVPLNVFESQIYDRASSLRTPSRESDEWFIDDMEDRGILDVDVVRDDYASICSSISPLKKVKDKHLQVQDYLLKNDEAAIAMEVPVWSGFLRLTGHIDLIRIRDERIEIVDYKPEGRFLRSMPQVAVYSYLLDSCYPNLQLENMKCVSFNESEAWMYSPSILRHLATRLDDGNLVEGILQRYDMMRGR